MKKYSIRFLILLGLIVGCSFFLSCKNYGSSETVVTAATAVAETTAVTETTVAPTVTASPTPTETTAKKIPIEPIDTAIRTDLPAPLLYIVTGQTATGKTAVWADETRETASRYLVAGDFVTVVAIEGSESRPYALLDTGEYVLLGNLEAAPVATATPEPAVATATPKPTKAPTKTPTATTTAPAATTAATPAATTATPAYYPNAENIRNLIVGSLQARGIWFPDGGNYGDDSTSTPVDYYLSDQGFVDMYVGGKFPANVNYGCSSVTVTIEKDADCNYAVIVSTVCPLP
jgi:hypothetical protein